MALSMFDQILFDLACGHSVVLGRLADAKTWTCAECGKLTELNAEPFRTELARDRDSARQIDIQAQQQGETVVRAG